MKFVSTRGGGDPVGFIEAMLTGLAPDGGLYIPTEIPRISPEVLSRMRGRSFPSVARTILGEILGDDPPRERVVAAVDSAFDFMVPLVHLPGNLQVLELFHGPTLAFKDFGARFMARMMAGAIREGRGGPVTVLTATSGDTGGAVANAFHGLDGVRVVVLFPLGRVSARQLHQFTTLGGNVTAVGVSGSFDDCQRMVKEAFADADLAARARLTSANSINVGRFLPQALYYFHAWAHQPGGPDPVYVVPSGNLGNLAAGLLAWRMGLPATGFVAATNANRGFVDYLATGSYEPGPAIRTVSSAMDVGDPSNLERLAPILSTDPPSASHLLVGSSHGDEQVLSAIHESFDRLEYVPDPHTAVGLLAARALPEAWSDAPPVVLGTAHPGKFPEAVERAIGQSPPVPPALKAALSRSPEYHEAGPSLTALRRFLSAG
jgi:threonine synthase